MTAQPGRITVFVSQILVGILLWSMLATPTWAAIAGPTIGPLRILTAGPIQKYAKLEVAFDITSAAATNVYFPYDPNPPPGIQPGIGISVNALMLPPGQADWAASKILPCFYYQPVQELGAGTEAALVPVGRAEWRCRFTPEIVGSWQYKIRVTDASGTTESPQHQFDCINSTRKGFVRLSQTDRRFFELSDGTAFVAPLVNMDGGSSAPFNGLANLRRNIQTFGDNGLHLLRWVPTDEGANFEVVPFGGDIRGAWYNGGAYIEIDDVDTAKNKLFSFSPYYYTSQPVPAISGARYRLSFRAKVTGERVLRAELGDLASLDICSGVSSYHDTNGHGDRCSYRQDGWNDYSLEVANSNTSVLEIGIRGLYVSGDAPQPYNLTQAGAIRLHSIRLQRFESDIDDWGANLLYRSDPDTYTYVDQIGAARLDELFSLSEIHKVYHKLTLFHKNDDVLNRFQPDGTVGAHDQYSRNFYSSDGLASRWYQRAYTRYFVARWSYSTALHSFELANENHFNDVAPTSFDAAFSLADYVHSVSPRHILMSNSFWGWFVASPTDPSTQFWNHPTRGNSMDYADQHWYARDPVGAYDGQLISDIFQDSAANVRECWTRFQQYSSWFNLNKPMMRGETGVTLQSNPDPSGQHPAIAQDTQGTWYHKKVWAQVGVLGYNCDGEWYTSFIQANNLWGIYASYDRFIRNEPLNNGRFEGIGTDLSDTNQILLSNSSGSLRAWGSRDNTTGRTLLWIDNANHTWWNVVQESAIPVAGARLTVQGLPAGTYSAEWWDTTAGAATRTETYTVGADGRLSFTVSNLADDVAVKFTNTELAQTSVPLDQGWNLVALPLIPADPSPGAIFASIAGQYSAVFAHNACDFVDPWKRFDPNAPAFVNDLTTISIGQGLWIQATADTTATITGSVPGGVSIPLCTGMNLFGYPAKTSVPLPDALASIGGKYARVYTYDPTDTADPWKMFDPSALSSANDLNTIGPGKGYWVQMRDPAVLVLNTQSATVNVEESAAGESAIHALPAVVTNDGPPSLPGVTFDVRKLSSLLTGRQGR